MISYEIESDEGDDVCLESFYDLSLPVLSPCGSRGCDTAIELSGNDCFDASIKSRLDARREFFFIYLAMKFMI